MAWAKARSFMHAFTRRLKRHSSTVRSGNVVHRYHKGETSSDTPAVLFYSPALKEKFRPVVNRTSLFLAPVGGLET